MGERERRLKLLDGSYIWPDGMVALDVEEPAGIDPWDDDEEAQRLKLNR